MFNFKKHNKQNVENTNLEKLMTPQDYAVYVEPKLQYQPILSKQQQDAVLADFTAWFNNYLKKYARLITRNTETIDIPESYISEDYIYYDKDNDKYHLLDFIADYLSNHGWEFKLKSYEEADIHIISFRFKLQFNYEKYAKQAKDDK